MKRKAILIAFMAIISMFVVTLPVYASHGYVNARVCYFGGSNDYLEANSWYTFPYTFDLINVRNYHYKKVSGSWVSIDEGFDKDTTPKFNLKSSDFEEC